MPIGHFNKKIFPGARFGLLTVIKRIPRNGKQRSRVLCHCDCGGASTPNADSLAKIKSCGCLKRQAGAKNARAKVRIGVGYGKIFKGAQFYRLTVIRRVEKDGRPTTKVKCRCQCGIVCLRGIDALVSGAAKSCGCWLSDVTTQRNRDTAKFASFSAKYPRTYNRWFNMICRCHKEGSTAYADYGGRGVFVCPYLRETPWNLKNLIGISKKGKPSLDRFPIHNGNYTCGKCPECKRNDWKLNVRWATRKQQAENRGDFNVYLTAFGKTLLRSQWEDLTGLGAECVRKRVLRGWTLERALTTPDKNGNCYTPGSVPEEGSV